MDILELLCDDHMVRKTRKQKEKFRRFLSGYCSDLGWDFRTEASGFTKNLIVGDPSGAKVIFVARYDTPIRSLFPAVLYPASRLRTFWSRYRYIFLLLLLFVLLSFLLQHSVYQAVIGGLYAVFVLFAGIRLWVGPANPENRNLNTSGVAVLLVLMQVLSANNRKKTAFVFVDNGAGPFAGSRKYASSHKTETDKRFFVDVSCVGRGNDFLVLPGSGSKAESGAKLLTAAVKKQTVSSGKTCMLTLAKRPMKTDAAAFPHSAYLCAAEPAGTLSMGIRKTGTPGDDIWEEENLQILSRGLRGFVESY